MSIADAPRRRDMTVPHFQTGWSGMKTKHQNYASRHKACGALF